MFHKFLRLVLVSVALSMVAAVFVASLRRQPTWPADNPYLRRLGKRLHTDATPTVEPAATPTDEPAATSGETTS